MPRRSVASRRGSAVGAKRWKLTWSARRTSVACSGSRGRRSKRGWAGVRLPWSIGGGALDWPRGVFGTIHCQGDLRGCLGRLEVDVPLGETVAHLAAIVSDSDPRVAPVASRELGDIVVEISVLTPEREIRSAEEIEVGCHGLIIEDGERRGLLLPQVATEHGWDRDALLTHTCLKASLPADAWRRGARIFIFEAQVFGEASLG
jgi:AmmeMemoRadiSam system protein A